METATEPRPKVRGTRSELRDTTRSSRRLLEPIDRISEIWFGLIMVLTFTCSLSVSGTGREEVRTMFIGAVGCNTAWGIIDGFMYLLGCFVERGRSVAALRALRCATDTGTARAIITDAMPPLLASVFSPAEFETIRQNLNSLPEPPVRPKLTKREWLGGIGVFLAVFLSTFPVVVPFLVTSDAKLALRVSNGVAILMLFLTGYAFGRHAGYRPWRMGLWMAAIGSGLVALAIVLGG